MKKLTQEWIDKAEKDYKVAKREYETQDPIYDAVCFHSQQCIEKYFKAILQENEIEFEKIHDLGFLLEKCKEILPEILFLKEDLLLLSAYAVEIRYPGIEADKEDAEKCIVTLEKIRKIIRKYFGLA